MKIELPAILASFSRKESLRLKYGGAAIVVLAGVLYWQLIAMQDKYERFNQEIVAMPDVKPEDNQGKLMSKAEGAALEKKLAKYKKIKATLEGFIPQDKNPKPAIITLNDVVQKIPQAIELEGNEKAEDMAMIFSEQILTGFMDTKNPKPVYRFQSLVYSFTFKATYTALVDFLKELDALRTFYFVHKLTIQPTAIGGANAAPTARDPKFAVELELQMIYMLNKGAAK